MLYSLNIYGS